MVGIGVSGCLLFKGKWLGQPENGLERRRLVANSLLKHGWFTKIRCRRAADAPLWVCFQAAFVYRIRLSENGICALWLALSVVFTFAPNRGAATYFLCFAKESKQRKATPTCRSASQTSLTPHPFFGACKLAVLRTSSDKRTLVSEKRMLRSAGRRGAGGSLKRL